MKTVSSGVMWVGRATTFCVGLAVVLAVVLGVSTTALAAVPGDPFKLGRSNAVDRVTSLVGSVAGPMLRVDNNGGGPALALESNTGRPPLTVNAAAGKATNLDADKLDGEDASAFLPSDGKARDAARADTAADAGTLDGKDSTDFYAAGSKAADAETLDGLDSSGFLAADGKAEDSEKLNGLSSGQFMRGATYSLTTASGYSSSTYQSARAQCPAGRKAISGGGYLVAQQQPENAPPVALTSVRQTNHDTWSVSAAEVAPYGATWQVVAQVVCVPFEAGTFVPEQ